MACNRTEVSRTFPLAGGRQVTLILRDAIVPEDPFLNLARAQALALRTGEPFDATMTRRKIKDSLIKTYTNI